MSGSRSGKTGAMEYVWVAVLILLVIGVLSLAGMLIGPRLWEMYGPATPTPAPEWRDIRPIYTSTDLMAGCVDAMIQLGPPEEKLYFYSALSVAMEMDLIPGMSEKENLDDFSVAWTWEPEEGLKYAVVVKGAVALKFVPLCTILSEDGMSVDWMVFESVEVKTL